MQGILPRTLDPDSGWRRSAQWAEADCQRAARYLANAKGMTATGAAAQETLNRLRDNHPKPQELVDRIFHECRTNIESTGRRFGDESGDRTLMYQKGSPLGRARRLSHCAAPPKSRRGWTTGFEIKKGQQGAAADLGRGLVYVDRWEPYDPEYDFARELAYNCRRPCVATASISSAPPIHGPSTADLFHRQRAAARSAASWASSTSAACRRNCTNRSRWS